MAQLEQRCRAAGCGGPQSGICLEKLSFDECPNVISFEEAGSEIADDDEPAPASGVKDLLSTGNQASLDVLACDRLLRSRAATVVGVVSGPKAGKTTLLTTIYEMVRKRRLANAGFAGSETVRGLEERAHHARVKSERSIPKTLRSPFKLDFVHLRLMTPQGAEDVVFADRSGEFFQRVRDTPILIADFAEIQRAEVLLFLVDGAAIASGQHRELADARLLFLAINQAGLLAGKRIAIVATKGDLLRKRSELVDLKARLAEFAEQLSKRANGVAIEAMVTEARPRRGSAAFGGGYKELVEFLLPVAAEEPFALTLPQPRDDDPLERMLLPFQARRP